MLEKMIGMLYDEDGLMDRIRDGGVPSEEEKLDLINFAKKVNLDLRNNLGKQSEIVVCFDVVYEFMIHDKLEDLAVEIYQNVMAGVEL